jgi:hypothetical protein
VGAAGPQHHPEHAQDDVAAEDDDDVEDDDFEAMMILGTPTMGMTPPVARRPPAPLAAAGAMPPPPPRAPSSASGGGRNSGVGTAARTGAGVGPGPSATITPGAPPAATATAGAAAERDSSFVNSLFRSSGSGVVSPAAFGVRAGGKPASFSTHGLHDHGMDDFGDSSSDDDDDDLMGMSPEMSMGWMVGHATQAPEQAAPGFQNAFRVHGQGPWVTAPPAAPPVNQPAR